MSLLPPIRRKGTNEKHKPCWANANYTNLTMGDGITVGASFGDGAVWVAGDVLQGRAHTRQERETP